MERTIRDEEHIRYDAHEHFLKGGDKVKTKGSFDAHAVYDVVRGDLTKYAYNRLGRNWMDAEDAVQDAFVNTIRTAKVNPLYNFGGLYKIWLDRAISKIRSENARREDVFVDCLESEDEEGLSLIDLAESCDPSSELLLEVQEKVDKLMSLTNAIQPRSKRIIRLSVLFGYSNGEVAEMLNVSIKTVKNTLHHFKKLYRKQT